MATLLKWKWHDRWLPWVVWPLPVIKSFFPPGPYRHFGSRSKLTFNTLYLSMVWMDCTLLFRLLALSGILLLTWHMQLSKQFILLRASPCVLAWVLTRCWHCLSESENEEMSEEQTLRVETERGLRERKDDWLPGHGRRRSHIATHELP